MPDTALRRTPKFIAQVRALEAEGVTQREIARRLLTSHHTVRKAMASKASNHAAPVLTEREAGIIKAGRAQGWGERRIAAEVGCSRTTVKLWIGEIEAQAARKPAQQRVAASATHREGGPSPGAPALAPNSMEASLIMRGMRPEVAAATARAWRDRHAWNDARSRRTGDGSRDVVAKEG